MANTRDSKTRNWFSQSSSFKSRYVLKTDEAQTSDGPAGARGALSIDGPTAAFLPAQVAQATTWSKEHLHSVGQLMCKEPTWWSEFRVL